MKSALEQAREFMDPVVGYSWTSWWDEKQAGPLIERLIEALALAEGEGDV